MFNIFSQLNQSALLNSMITLALASIVLYIAVSFLMFAISDICKERKAHNQMINEIVQMKMPINRMRKLAKSAGISSYRKTKYMLANELIEALIARI